MRCPLCTTDETRVVDSRPSDAGAAIRRRRECSACGHRFTTYERRVGLPMVRKRDGRVQAFDVAKLRKGLENALADRPTSPSDIDAIVARVEALVQSLGSEVSADEIGREVLAGLLEIDEAAYLRFASVYKEFAAASDFEREMAAIEGES